MCPGVETDRHPGEPIRVLRSSVSGATAGKALPALCQVGWDPVGPLETVRSGTQPPSSLPRTAVRRLENSWAREGPGGPQSIGLWQGTMTEGVEALLSRPASRLLELAVVDLTSRRRMPPGSLGR